MKPIVIIGSGLAGYGVAREFRKLNSETPLMIITADDGCAYSKPLLSNALSKGKTADQLSTASSEKMASQLNADIRTHTRITSIDSTSHTVTIEGEKVEYSKLVLAVGASPIHPHIEGDASKEIVSINNIDDYARFRAILEQNKSVTILGGGLIGCEFANDLANSGYSVDIIDRNFSPLAHLLPEAVGIKLHTALTEAGVKWHNRSTVKSINRNNDLLNIELENGNKLTSKIILSAIGLRANISIAQDAGLSTNRGIVVNTNLEASAKDVYALGDCAEVNQHFLPFIMPLMRCTKALAQTLNNNETAVSYPAMPVTLKTPAFPISVLPPSQGSQGSWIIEDSDDAIRALFKDDNEQLKGFALGGKATAEGNKLASTLPSLF